MCNTQVLDSEYTYIYADITPCNETEDKDRDVQETGQQQENHGMLIMPSEEVCT